MRAQREAYFKEKKMKEEEEAKLKAQQREAGKEKYE